MSAALSPPPFAILIDTDMYAGNFERQMCAYITGCIGECGVGEKQAEQAKVEMPEFFKGWVENNITSAPDDHGCNRPASIWWTHGVFNDGHGNEWPEGSDPEEVRRKYEAAVRGYYEPLIERNKHRIGEPAHPGRVSWEEQIGIWEQNIVDSIARGPGHFHAYHSVAIFCVRKPTKKVWTVIKERAKAFATTPPQYCSVKSILGFRLVKLKLKVTELKVPNGY